MYVCMRARVDEYTVEKTRSRGKKGTFSCLLSLRRLQEEPMIRLRDRVPIKT